MSMVATVAGTVYSYHCHAQPLYTKNGLPIDQDKTFDYADR